MRKFIVLCGLLLAASLTAQAQEYPRVEIFTGYSYARMTSGSPERSNLNGWNVAIQGNVTDWFGLVADFSGHYGQRTVGPGIERNINTHAALFGPRIQLPARVRPFAHALFGVAKGSAGLFGSTSSETAFGMAVGGGIDAELTDHVTLRLIQADYLMNQFFDRRRDNFRISTGLVFRF
jgi:opacity protein-like surface antigen